MHDVQIKRRLVQVRAPCSSADRATAAQEISRLFRAGRLDGAARAQAEDIFEILAHDIAVAVRETLAVELCRCPFLPRRIARTPVFHQPYRARLGTIRPADLGQRTPVERLLLHDRRENISGGQIRVVWTTDRRRLLV